MNCTRLQCELYKAGVNIWFALLPVTITLCPLCMHVLPNQPKCKLESDDELEYRGCAIERCLGANNPTTEQMVLTAVKFKAQIELMCQWLMDYCDTYPIPKWLQRLLSGLPDYERSLSADANTSFTAPVKLLFLKKMCSFELALMKKQQVDIPCFH